MSPLLFVPCKKERSQMTPQEQMKNRLKKLGIPSISIDVYGKQIVIQCRGKLTSEKWNSVLYKICKRVRVVKTKKQTDATLHFFTGKKYYDIYLIGGTI